MHYPTDRIVHNTTFATPVVEHWLEQEIAQRVHQMGLIPDQLHTCWVIKPLDYASALTHWAMPQL